MSFFLTFLVSLGGLLLLFIPLPAPLFVPVGVAGTGWAVSHLLTPRTPTDLRLRRLGGVMAAVTAGLALLWYLLLGGAVLFLS